MEHRKTYIRHTLPYQNKEIVIEGPITSTGLLDLQMHPDLDAFRRPREQHEALVEIAGLPEGRIILARVENIIIGYVTFHYPDEMERWSQAHMPDLIELGAIEVSNEYRSLGLGSRMIQTAFEDNQMEHYIVFTTEYYWHWDLKSSGLSVWDYRKMMERLMQTVDMFWYATDDPEICSHPANCLMVRIGKNVPLESEEQFDRLRFQQRFMY
ncbi:acetoin utilization protein AcuA [Paenibacillus anaericanus]|uniref:GNAT family N-acetyltransferase n=1 Tax=Paenibacillus anaericanus TaxID=170367 RepID=A0A433YDA4_9BACL|nr:GNAT family N-acetyltransferase [Paenibacillus anaericanus]MDQ0088331.1 acetoin utilization protein AcuA [Paenibacillus anaericanus]RUT47866.1 GNAT family N-acetyltransferase [Paenibacillus anaericanus]